MSRITFEEWKQGRDKVEAAHRGAAKILADLAPERNALGLVPDHIKQSKEWQQAHLNERRLFANLRETNSYGVRHFKFELDEERNQRRQAKLQQLKA